MNSPLRNLRYTQGVHNSLSPKVYPGCAQQSLNPEVYPGVHNSLSTLRYTRVCTTYRHPEVYPGMYHPSHPGYTLVYNPVYRPPHYPFVGGTASYAPHTTRFTVGRYCMPVPHAPFTPFGKKGRPLCGTITRFTVGLGKEASLASLSPCLMSERCSPSLPFSLFYVRKRPSSLPLSPCFMSERCPPASLSPCFMSERCLQPP